MRRCDGQSPTAPVATPAPVPVGVRQVMPGSSTRSGGVSVLAVLTLLVGFVPFLGAVAVPLGWRALVSLEAKGQRGRIPAIIGLVVGALWALDCVLWLLRPG